MAEQVEDGPSPASQTATAAAPAKAQPSASGFWSRFAIPLFAVLVALVFVAVATSRNIVRSAFALLAVLFSVAALYAVMKADFIAAAQVLIYVGGILVLIIFAVMLTYRITDVKLSNDSTPGPAAFCACLCLLFSLVVVILFTAKWRRDSDVATQNNKVFEVALRQYQSDGSTGLAFGGTSVEDPPGIRDLSFGKLYLAYVRDPDGNKLCGLHRPAQ